MASTLTTNLGLQKQGTGDNPGTWGANLNTNVIDLIDSAFGSAYAANVAGSSDVTLSTTNAGNLVHNLTGIITANINYIFPATAGRFLIINNATTGSFSITVKPSGGTGVVIPQGTKQFIYIDSSATTAYAPVSLSALGGLAAANNLSDVTNAATARTNLGLGSAAVLASSAVALTANNLSDLASAATARTNLGLGTASTQTTGTFLQVANNLSDLGTLATALTNLGFITSAGTSGYVKLPGGIYIQWGQSSTITAGGTLSINFPITFPNNIYVTLATGTALTNVGNGIAVTAQSASAFTGYNSTNTNQGIYFIAIGN